jgi:hypothetical protein
MALDGMQRVLEIHAQWLQSWREQLDRLESGKIRSLSKGPGDRDWVDDTQSRVDELKRQIAIIEQLDKHYRP